MTQLMWVTGHCDPILLRATRETYDQGPTSLCREGVLNAVMFDLLNAPSASALSDQGEPLCRNEHGTHCLDDTNLHATLRIEPGSKILPRETICVVDDDPLVLNSVGRLLESAGLRVVTFSEPRKFLEYVAENSVPLAILDIWMEEMTGMELLAHLCARSPQTRVIFMSGREDSAAKATVMQAGALAFFIKPFNNDDLLTAVGCALGLFARSRASSAA